MIAGLYIAWGNKDMSKSSGFLLSLHKPFAPFLHVLVGFIIGLLVYPAKYSWENLNKPHHMNAKVWSRQITGVVIYTVFTLRNAIKHPKNLKKNLNKCIGNINDYSFFASSFTKQQTQLLLGGGLGVLFGQSVINKNRPIKYTGNVDRIAIILTSLTFLQIIVHIVVTRNKNYNEIKKQLQQCKKE